MARTEAIGEWKSPIMTYDDEELEFYDIDVLQATWKPMGTKDCVAVHLPADSMEFRIVSELFQTGTARNSSPPSGCHILRILRIQNTKVWGRYVRKFQAMKKYLGGARTVKEVRLLHGTRSFNVDSICKDGFDTRRAEKLKKPGALGIASYFSWSAYFSSKYGQGLIQIQQALPPPRITQTAETEDHQPAVGGPGGAMMPPSSAPSHPAHPPWLFGGGVSAGMNAAIGFNPLTPYAPNVPPLSWSTVTHHHEQPPPPPAAALPSATPSLPALPPPPATPSLPALPSATPPLPTYQQSLGMASSAPGPLSFPPIFAAAAAAPAPHAQGGTAFPGVNYRWPPVFPPRPLFPVVTSYIPGPNPAANFPPNPGPFPFPFSASSTGLPVFPQAAQPQPIWSVSANPLLTYAPVPLDPLVALEAGIPYPHMLNLPYYQGTSVVFVDPDGMVGPLYVVMARVMLGRWTYGHWSDQWAPPLDRLDPQSPRCDSTINQHDEDVMEFAIFDPCQIYPEYVVEFRAMQEPW